MHRGTPSKSLWVLVARTALWSVLTESFATVAQGEHGNATSLSGLPYWSTSNDESDFLRLEEAFTASYGNDVRLFGGGFSYLDGVLQWAIGHSDPDKLNETALDLQRLSSRELKQRQTDIRNLLNEWKTPTDVQLMQRAIHDLENTLLSRDENLSAMQEILILVEPVDNANDFNKIGGLHVMVHFLNHDDPDMRKYSAWIIGKSGQNNPVVQNQVLDLGGLTRLMVMVNSTFVEEAVKALYAISSVVRNNFVGQELFFSEDGHLLIQDILGNSSKDVRLHKKAATLVSDIVESLLENSSKDDVLPLFGSCSFLKYFANLLEANDYDLQEKALFAIMNLLRLGSSKAPVPIELCGLDTALARLRQQLDGLMADELHLDFAADMEMLRMEVELFLRKLQEGNVAA